MKEKQQVNAKPQASALQPDKKAPRLLLRKELLGVLGGVRIHIPIGYADDTTPIYDDRDTTG